jgi:hypothetical protein
MIPSCLQLRIFTFLKRIWEIYLSRIRKKNYPLAQNPQKIPSSGTINTCSMKTLRIREENPATWYSNNVRQPVITPNALSQSIKLPSGMPCKSTRILFHHLASSPPAPEEKTPKPWQTKASNPSRRTAPHQRSAPFKSEFSFNLLLALIFNLTITPSCFLQP